MVLYTEKNGEASKDTTSQELRNSHDSSDDPCVVPDACEAISVPAGRWRKMAAR